MLEKKDFSYENIKEKLISYLSDKGYSCSPGYYDSIKFCTGVDTWLLFITEVSTIHETVCMVLLHKDNLSNQITTTSKKHKLYKGIPDYHIQEKVMYTQDIYQCVNTAINHTDKWNPESK